MDEDSAEDCGENFIDNKERTKTKKFNPLLRQILACSGPVVLMTAHGMVTGYSAILLPQLNEQNSSIKVTKTQESWIASMAPLQMAVGCLLCGWSMETFGRKSNNLISSVLSVIGWLFLYMASSVEYLLFGRILTGFCVGQSSASIACYIGEISQPAYRGFLLATISFAVAFGIFLVHLLGTFLNWNVTALATTFVPLLAFVLCAYCPESHMWYANKGCSRESWRSFTWFRGGDEEASKELVQVLAEKAKSATGNRRFVELNLNNYYRPEFLKPLGITSFYFAVSQFTGNNSIAFYTVSIMQSTVPGIDKYIAMLVVDFIRVLMTIVACIMTRKFRIRQLSIFSGITAALSLLVLSLLIYLSDLNPDNKTLSVVAIVPLISYIVMFNIGLFPLGWTLCGELFHPNTKGMASGISTFVNYISFFVVVKVAFELLLHFGSSATFMVFGCITSVGVFVLYFILPETKDKTLTDIQDYFVKQGDSLNKT